MNHKVEQALQALQAGKLVIVMDDEDRESEGDLVGISQFVTPEAVNFMTTYARGLICVPLAKELAEEWDLQPMTGHNTDKFGTNFTISVDHRSTSTGISAFDRAATIQALGNKQTTAADFYLPGHIFPLIAETGGVLKRRGHTEAAVDLARLAGAVPAGYICEILNPDGTMARRATLEKLAEEWGLIMITIDDIVRYRQLEDTPVESEVTVSLPTAYGNFSLEAFTSLDDGQLQLLVSKGKLDTDEPLLVRLHSECLTGDVLGSHRCDCGEQLEKALATIEKAGRGAVLYLRQEGRGIGLLNKLKAYALQENGYDTYDANVHLGFAPDSREYHNAAAILKEKGIRQVRLMTNNPEKVQALEDMGIEVVERVPLEVGIYPENSKYLTTKAEKFHHLLHIENGGEVK